MINGAHLVIHTLDAEADRAFIRDVLKFPSVDAGHGWLIFAFPPTEAAFHPAEQQTGTELYFLCENLESEIAALTMNGVTCSPVSRQRWGSITKIRLPSGLEIGLYQPAHPTALGLKTLKVSP